MGSGNLVHNLHAYARGRQQVAPLDWAVRFEERARELLLADAHDPLIAYETLGRDASLSIPTPDPLSATPVRDRSNEGRGAD
jgi:4,5-DOPA dioxygenase extradiol